MPVDVIDIYRAVKGWGAYRKELNALKATAATGTPEEIRKGHATLRQSFFYSAYDDTRLYPAAIRRNEPEALSALLPDGNPNKVWSETGPYFESTTSLLSAVIEAGSEKNARDLAQRPDIDARAGTSLTVYSMDHSGSSGFFTAYVAEPIRNKARTPAQLAEDAGMHDVARMLETRAAAQDPESPPTPAIEQPSLFRTLSMIFARAQQEHMEARDFARLFEKTRQLIKSGDIGEIVTAHKGLIEAGRLSSEDQNVLVRDALYEDNPAAVFAVLPDGNPNFIVEHTDGNAFRADPLITAAIVMKAERTLQVLGNLPGVDYRIQSEVMPLPMSPSEFTGWYNVGGPAQVARAYNRHDLVDQLAFRAARQSEAASPAPEAPPQPQ